ncbi:alkanesulfonate monooxygenase SsuD/methylene tetrahydromethanopterin reductase-like flavin-dependent oxidoreductase (luciferase family) [Pseudonocardia hierapolitana]|uniref:Alkanesulfonate monooxygenase SsuD/methylene tetrahydromethanopterin reductase-like flavin-dependent oxidoreductase (Luciferase family) n=1 Tax=Pseudonocardia hierapolitana TaxID=1128676 RepID=A0A561T0A3_9PSEU|nr:LLM class flavin-dependent oxidoreductase [Pseudonocardia hierapolitana]TWF80542.1 alkanesulfonate monooxygenase SsuD/methylene tetrahydromethanopterin reductase-like flavin-dependent oxidoreductase (luciferase family) [Pseudonocardia hierapolitana]
MTSDAQRATIGIGFFPASAPAAIDLVERAERAGVNTAWLVMPPLGHDTMTVAAAALARTARIRVGTSIVPAFTRHPLNLATQAIALAELAPGRFRLGVGTGNLAVMANGFGTPITRPVARVREYVDIVRTALGTGEARHAGEFHTVDAKLPHPAQVEVSLAALGPRMFESAGAVADAAMSWNVPLDHLDTVARPAIARGAAAANRPAPPIITHVNVMAGTDREELLAAGRAALLPFTQNAQYTAMFEAAGLPVGADREPTPALIDALVVGGDEAAMAERLGELAATQDELLVSLPWPAGVRRDQEDAVLRVLGALGSGDQESNRSVWTRVRETPAASRSARTPSTNRGLPQMK